MVAAQVMHDLGWVGLRDAADADAAAVDGTLPPTGADSSIVLTALGAQRYAPGRFMEPSDGGRRRFERWDEECGRYGGGDVFSEGFRAQCAARRGAKFRKPE